MAYVIMYILYFIIHEKIQKIARNNAFSLKFYHYNICLIEKDDKERTVLFNY